MAGLIFLGWQTALIPVTCNFSMQPDIICWGNMVRPDFQPIKQEKISTKIAEQIKSLIAKGDLKPGDLLPPERELVKIFKVSRA